MPRRKKVIPEGRELDAIRELLEGVIPWPPELRADHTYSVQTDDTDGQPNAPRLRLLISAVCGDIFTGSAITEEVRIRHLLGGGRHRKVFNALMMLAYAMHMEEEAAKANSVSPD